MPKHKKNFINRKTATSFALVQRSQQDKYAGDSEAPQHVLKDISRKAQQRKYGVFFEDDYDYLQHLRRPYGSEVGGGNESDNEPQDHFVEEHADDQKDLQSTEHEQLDDVSEEESLPHGANEPQFRLHENLMGYDDPIYDSRLITNNEEVDEDILEAMMRVEAGDEDEDLPDDFIQLASSNVQDDEDDYDDDEMEGLTNTQQALMSHFLDTLGGDETRLADFAIHGDDQEGEEDLVQQLRDFRLKMEDRGDDYHSQCLGVQIEKLVEDAVTYDVDEIRSRISGVSCALTESMKQALETDKRFAESRLVKNPDCLMTIEEKSENIERTLAMVREDSSSSDEEDPVQAWVEFDRRPRVTANVDSTRVGYKPMDDVLGSCTVHPAAVSLKKETGKRRDKSRTTSEMEDEGRIDRSVPERIKTETSEEKRQRKAAVKALQKERRVAKKENKLTFKAEAARQQRVTATSIVTHTL